MTSKGGMQFKILLKKNGVVFFSSKDDANTFRRFLSNLADSLLQKLPSPKKIGIKTTEEYYWHIRNKYKDFVNSS